MPFILAFPEARILNTDWAGKCTGLFPHLFCVQILEVGCTLRGDAAIHKDNGKDAHLWDFVNSRHMSNYN